jgi:glycosyltransferase involved in cell wall biosynthesis
MSSEGALQILYVINGLGEGGAERSLAETLPELDARGVDATVVCLYQRQQGVQQQVLDGGFDVRFLRSNKLRERVRDLTAIVEEQRPHLIHTSIFEADVTGRLAGRRARVPVMTSLVSTPYAPIRRADPNVKRWKLRALQAVDAWSARRWTAHFHANSESVKEAAIRDLGIASERVTVIRRGRDTARLGQPSPERKARVRERLGIPPQATVVLNVGRQKYAKGQRTLLEAAAALAAGNPNLVVLIAGRAGNLTSRLMSLHDRLGLGDRVRFLGHRDDVPDLLAAADVFAFPSLYEGSPGAVMEAMALEVPIVASDLPSVREVTGEDLAVLVPPDDASALAGAIRRVIQDPEGSRRRATRAHAWFLERFTIDRVVDETVALYERLASPARMRTR